MFMLRCLWNVQSHCEKQVNVAPKSASESDEMPQPFGISVGEIQGRV